MTSERVKKRLHISGLTTKITIDDIVSRFESFGTVSDTTGFGQLNAVGTPRPFAFLTLETSKERLARCLASLSGTTWKGARLRVGEARPDWKERLAKENSGISSSPPAKRRRIARGTVGVHAENMALVTSERLRSGWHLIDGRLIRPLRMRPTRPLPLRIRTQSIRKIKRRNRPLSLRSRTRTIDPIKFGSRHHIFSLEDLDLDANLFTKHFDAESAQPRSSLTSTRPVETNEVEESQDTELQEEKDRALRIFENLFANADKWEHASDKNSAAEESLDATTVKFAHEASVEPIVSRQKKLENIFSFDQEDGGFTLFGDGQLDIDSDVDALFQQPSASQVANMLEDVPAFSIVNSRQKSRVLAPDPRQPLFFPSPSEAQGRDVVRALENRVAGEFMRTETSEEIRIRWDAEKLALTRDWKKRHREAVKLRRIRVGKAV